MRHKLVLLALSFLLASCSQTPTSENVKEETNDGNQTQEQSGGSSSGGNTESGGSSSGGNTEGGGSSTGGNTEGGGSSSGGNTEGGGSQDNTLNEYVPDNKPYSLEDYTEFSFHDGREPDYPDDWDVYLKTTHNANGFLWTNPNEKSECSGVELSKDMFAVSPMFNSWKKVEVRLDFWFSSHQASKYKGSDKEPQFYIEQYDKVGKFLHKDEINIKRSDIPSNNTAKQVKQYFDEDDCAYFILRWNNYIPNGDSGYSAILCDVTLKGWNYDL